MKSQIIQSTVCLILCSVFSINLFAQNGKKKIKAGVICGNPQINCGEGNANFQPYELGFKSSTAVAESETFYAIILKTVALNSQTDCEELISENERMETQNLFPNNKVFALKCSEPGEVFYTNVKNNVSFLAVYAGKTLPEANKFLKTVQSTKKIAGANLRKMKAGINGT